MKRTTQVPKKHQKKRQLAVATALALGMVVSSDALAVGMPGAGTVTVGSVTASAGIKVGGGVGTVITGLASGVTLTVKGNSVVQWGGYNPAGTNVLVAALKADTNPAGFNVAPGNTLTFTNATAPAVGVLNVDASGNPSVIAGTILNGAVATKAVNIFIANANGITVTSTGTIAAPVVGLLGANNLAAAPGAGGLPVANAAQTAFAANTMPVTFGNNGSILVQGTIEGSPIASPANAATNVIIAGSGSVNVNYDHIVTKASGIYGGTALTTLTTAGVATLALGSKTTQVTGYAPTNVTLNDANPSQVFANGGLAFTGFSTLPSNKTAANYGWTGVLSNTGTLGLTDNFIGGLKSSFTNPWFNTVNPVGSGFVNTPVGSVNNSGTINSGAASLSIFANGITNTGTLNVQPGGTLTLTSNSGDINLGGTVQANNATPAILSATLIANKSGNINVTAPLTLNGSGATFTVTDTPGNVSLAGVLSLVDTAANSTGTADYAVSGNAINITANQTVANANGTTTLQPTATLNVNQLGQTVTIGDGATLTAGNVMVGTTVAGALINRVNLIANGNITATNTGSPVAAYTDGDINVYATNVSGDGTGTMTGQVFGFDVTGNIRKSAANLTNNYWTNGLVLTSAGNTPTLNLLESAPGRQFVNLRDSGNLTVNSYSSTGGAMGAGFYGTTGTAAFHPANAFSQMMLMSTGNMTLGGDSTVGGQGGTGVAGGNFWFPGLSYFGSIVSLANPNSIGAGSISSAGSVYNDFPVPVASGQGVYFMTNSLNLSGSVFTNMNSWVNFASSALQNQYAGAVYTTQYSGQYSNTVNVVPASNQTNVYTIPAN